MIKLLVILFFSFEANCAEVLKVGLFDIQPFGYENKSGALGGVIYKLLKEIEKETHIKFQFQLLPYYRLLKSLTEGKTDFAIFYPSEKYKTKFQSVAPTLGNVNYIVSHKIFNIKKLSDLKGKNVAMVRGANYKKDFDDANYFKKILLNDYNQCLHMLVKKRIHATVISSAAYKYFCKKEKLDCKKNMNIFVLGKQKNWLHMRFGLSDKFIKKIKQANTKVLKDKNYTNLEDLLTP